MSRSLSRNLLLAAVMIGAIAAAYAPSLGGGFLWDDDTHITANPTIVGPLGLKEIWTTARANYFPLVLTNFRAQHALWELNPLGYRLVTLLCHAGAAVLLWRVLLRLRVPGAWLGTALWALHPVQVESVAWICELKNTQSAVFFLAAILFWIRWVEGPPWLRRPAAESNAPAAGRRSHVYILAFACAVLAILSKPSTVMLPVALALVTWWLRRRFAWRDLIALGPFLALSAVAAGWTIWEQKFHSGAVGDEWNQSWAERAIIAGRAGWFYLEKLVWPARLSFIYPRWVPDAARVADYLPVLLAASGLVWLTWRRERQRATFVAAGFFVALLFPVLGFFDVYFFRYAFVGDHFQYLAGIGPLALLAAGLAVTLPRWLPIVGGVAALAFATLTAVQSADYRSSETLWRATVARNPGSAMAWAQLGSVHEQAGRQREALACFQRALRINPKHPEALNHLGCAYLLAGRVPEGIAELERAIEARPGFAEAHSNLGIALVQAGRANEALAHFVFALEARPDAVETRHHYAKALATLGRPADASAEFAVVAQQRPGDATVHENFGNALRALGRSEQALAEFARAIELKPARASAHNDLGATLAPLGRMAEALAQFDEAVRLDPGYAAAHVNRGGALASLGRLDEAREAFARAVELDPDSAAAHNYLGQILQAQGRENEARAHLERAARLQRPPPAAR